MTDRPSEHERLRGALEVASDVEALTDLLVAGGLIDRRPWRRHVGRFRPDQPAWATIVLATGGADLATVEIRGRPGRGGRLAAEHCHVTPFHADPAMPGLEATLAALDGPRVVRYRPGSRCTIVASSPLDRRVVKVSSDWRELDRIGHQVWRTAQRADLGADVAEPLGVDAERMESHQSLLSGEPAVGRLLGRGGPAWSERMGSVLGELATRAVEPGAVHASEAQLARTARAVRRAAHNVPALGERMGVILTQLTAIHAGLDRRRPVPVHGSPHPQQWLVDGGRLGLVDFDRFGLGDPELDVATFLAELDSESLADPVGEHEQAICDGYARRAGALDPERLWLYRVHKRCAKVARTATALRADGDRRAERHLRSVERLIARDAHRPDR